jgi:hypothetical protein
MNKISTNPLANLTLEELNLFQNAIDKNFQVTTINGEIKEDLHTRWSDLNEQCLKYAYWNHERITKDYPKMENRSYGDIIRIMINQEIEKL